MLTLQESLFDSNLVSKDPIDWQRFKDVFVEKKPEERYNLFSVLRQILSYSTTDMETLRDMLEIYWSPMQIEEFEYQHLAFEYIINALNDAFKKQGGTSWFDITESDFEKIGDEMDDDEKDYQNDELNYFIHHANTTAHESHFMVGNGELPESVKFILGSLGWINVHCGPVGKLLKKPKEWAVDYFDRLFGGQLMFIYVCPKNLDPFVKKLLYK